MPEDAESASAHPLSRRDTLLFALAGLAGVGAAGEGRAASALHAEIEAVLRRTEEIWNSQHFYRLRDVWDTDDPEPWYVPEEIATPFRSWPEIERYWAPPMRVLKAFRWEFSNLHVKGLADDLALALFDHYYEIEVAIGRPPLPPPTAGFDRCLAIFRRKSDGWKHILYAQCPLGPDTYIRALRERIVRPDFRGFSDDVESRFREGHADGKPRTPPAYDPSRSR